MTTARHVFLGELASGGFGRVFLARDEFLGREVAIKRVRHDQRTSSYFPREQLLHEAKVLAAVQHPNIVTIYDVARVESSTEIVMEYVAGVTVRQLVNRHLLTAYDFKVLAKQMLCGLAAAHEHEILHCDIKPSNVMIASLSESRMVVKLLDFGMSPSSDSSKQQLVGSALFMAPEIYEGKGHSVQTDLYSLGCLFYYMLAGVVPFDGRDTIEVMAAHCGGDFHPLSHLREDLAEDLCSWVELFISSEPEKRFHDCHEALEELKDLEFPLSESERDIELTEGIVQIVRPVTPASLKPACLEERTRPQGVCQMKHSEMLHTRKISAGVRAYAEREAERLPVYRLCASEVKPPKQIEEQEVLKLRKEYWYAMLHGRRTGPLDMEAIGRLILGGYIGSEDLVWHEGWNDWRRADECPLTGVYLCEYQRTHRQITQPVEVKHEKWHTKFVEEFGWEMCALVGLSLMSFVAVYIYPHAWMTVMSAFSILLVLGGFLSLKCCEGKEGKKWLVAGLLIPVIGDVYYACGHRRKAMKGLTLIVLGGVFLAGIMNASQWSWEVLDALFAVLS
ncbi:Serine/threonine protein kinase [Rubritalea squalenifaciens DSM 18772]|uniref:Serine/threonine protein kinase n=1 Tax=Rubritalea squalenifaciens DSM 18772 TaxID=1123071 RepID=A0A1M6KPJ5_9BACT|nr:protein kinase [Rubritalea squalenifaciens]SHJ60811.1 Serine/threonine protein kinase [Rubritalea squalenifaciens DSM 18772]